MGATNTMPDEAKSAFVHREHRLRRSFEVYKKTNFTQNRAPRMRVCGLRAMR